jgi:pantoate--beta-alanine ligase
VQPERAYFGKKDYQQLAVIRHLVRSLRMPVEIIGCETLREQDGLAMSSRNMRLTKEQRNLASGIFKTLCYARDHANKLAPEEICLQAIRQIDALPGFRTEYFEIAEAETLQPITRFESGHTSVACTAVYAGEVRLIDNMEIFS